MKSSLVSVTGFIRLVKFKRGLLKHDGTMLVQPSISPEEQTNQSVWNRFHPEQLQSGLYETNLH